MDFFIEQLIDGLTLGAVYALLAMAFSFAYGATGAFSFATGGVCLIAALASALTLAALTPLGIAFAPLVFFVALISAIAVGFAGWVLQRNLRFEPAEGSGLLPLFGSAGLLMAAAGCLQLAGNWAVPFYMHPLAAPALVLFIPGILNIRIPAVQPAIIATGILAIIAIAYAIRKTGFGQLQRAVVQDRHMAELLGVRVVRIQSICILISASLAAAAGWMATLDHGPLGVDAGLLTVVYGLAAAVLGRLGSLRSAVAGGILLGMAQTFWSGYFGQSYAAPAIFAGLIFVLRFLPRVPAGHSVSQEL